MLLFCPVKWDPTFWASRKRGDFDDLYVKRAKIDQKNADYPGCKLGLMKCLSTSCLCNERRPHPEFVRTRAFYLMQNGIPDGLEDCLACFPSYEGICGLCGTSGRVTPEMNKEYVESK